MIKLTVGVQILISLNFSISNNSFRPEIQNTQSVDKACQNLRIYNPNLENGAIYELFKGAKNVEHAQTRQHLEKPLSSIIELEASQKDMPKENRTNELHSRSDVVNKTLLRAVKRFFLNKFKITQRSMVRKRFKNVKTSHILDALAMF